MSDAGRPTPRQRIRTRLSSFEAACRGTFPIAPWVDRLQFAIGRVSIAPGGSSDDLFAYLQDVRAEESDLFTVERPGNNPRSLRIEFKSRRWLFGLRLNLRMDRGRWVGAGTLDLNATRMFAGLAANRAPDDDDLTVETSDLMRLLPDFDPARATLDGGDNFVPDQCLARAINLNWPRHVQNYVNAVHTVVTEFLRPARNFHRSDTDEWLLRLPPPQDWSLKQIEIYCEVADPNALLRVNEVSANASALTSAFVERLFGSPPAVSNEQRSNMASLSFHLGAENVNLTIYAKSHDRVRVEVRYNKHPLKTCSLKRSDYSGTQGVSRLVNDLRLNAHRRLSAFFRAYGPRARAVAPSMASLTSLLSFSAIACGNDPVLLSRVLALLTLRGGLSHDGHEAMPRVIEALLGSHVLQANRAALRARREDYVLAPEYARTMIHLRRLSSSEAQERVIDCVP